MGVSFNISRHGKRYMHKQLLMSEDKDNGKSDDQQNENDIVMNEDNHAESSGFQTEDQEKENETGGNLVEVGHNVTDHSIVLAKTKSGVQHLPEDLEVSFALNLFPDGFTVSKATELLSNVPKMLHPYNRTSEELFSAVEYGYLPGDYFDNLPCQYVNGAFLCEVRDFRNCLIQMGESTSHVKKSPIAHKVLLKMSMENVIKDVSSMSDDSWSYKDHLEVESRILKAMQPNLSLNPKPVQDIFRGQSTTRKLNLEIPWSSKKRKLIDTSETRTESNMTPVLGVGNNQKSESPPSLALQDRGVTYFQKTIVPCSKTHSGEDNIFGETILPKEYAINHPSSLREPGTLVLSKKGRCKKQTQGPMLKKPKEEPAEFSLQQLSGSPSETILAPETRQTEKQSQLCCASEKIPCRRVDGEKQPSRKVKDGQQVNLEGISKLQSGVLACPVKQESENCNISRSDSGCTYQKLQKRQLSSLSKTDVQVNSIPLNDMVKPVEQYLSKAVTNERIPLMKPLFSTSLGSASVNVNSSHRDSFLRESSVLGKRKLNSHSQGLSVNIVESLPSIRNMKAIKTSSCPGGSSSSSSPLGANDDPILKRFSKIEMVTHRYGLHDRKRKVDKVLDKKPIFKTSLVSNHLNSKDNNLKAGNTDDALQMRMLNFVHPFQSGKGNESSIHVSETQTKLVLSKKPNEGMVEGRMIYGQGDEIDASDSPLKSTFLSTHEIDKFASQFVSQMAHEGFVLAGDKIKSSPGTTDQGSCSQPPHPSICATPAVGTVMPPSLIPTPGQTPYIFSSLTRSTQIPYPRKLQSQDLLTSGHLRQQSVITSGATSATGTVEPPSPSLIPGQSPYFGSVTGSMPILNRSQFPSHNFLSGAHLLPSGNIQSSLQPSANYSSNPLLKNASQASSLNLHWQQILRNRIRLLYQRQQRERQQREFMKRNILMRGVPAASGNLGMMHQGVDIQGSTNPHLGYSSNFLNIGGPSSVSIGSHVPRLGNLGQVNNLGSNILGFNESSHRIRDGISDSSDATLARMMLAQCRQRSLLRGVPVQSYGSLAMTQRSINCMARQPPTMHTSSSGMTIHPSSLPHLVAYNNMPNQQLQTIHGNAGLMPIDSPPVQRTVRNFPFEQPPSTRIHEELCITRLQLQYQRMIPPLIPCEFSLQELSRQLQIMNTQMQAHAGNQAVAPEAVAMSFPRVGSRVGSNQSSTMTASYESGDISTDVNTGGIEG